MEALAKANRTRGVRKVTKRTLQDLSMKRSCRAAADLIEQPPPEFRGMLVADLLRAVRGFGHVRVRRLLTRAGVSPRKMIGGLTERQRRELCRVLREAGG